MMNQLKPVMTVCYNLYQVCSTPFGKENDIKVL